MSNRFGARLLLVASAVTLGAVALLLALRVPAVADRVELPLVTVASDQLVRFAERAETSLPLAAASAAGALAVAVLLVVFAITRGRGRTGTVLEVSGEVDLGDRVEITVGAIRDIVRHEAGMARSVERVDVDAYHVGRRRLRRAGVDVSGGVRAALLLTASVSKGASPDDARRELSEVVRGLDRALEVTVPVAVHLTAARGAATRAQ